MKYAMLALIGLGTTLGATSALAQAPTPGATELKTTDQKIAYSLGVNIGRGMKQSEINFDPNIIAQGRRDGLNDKVVMTDAQMAEVMEAFKQQMMAKQQEMMAKQQQGAAANNPAAEKNLKAGQAFLADNKTKPGVTTLPSGVQYKVLTKGTGKTPKLTDVVSANYKGTLIDGTEFDGVITGWTEVLQLMKEGDKYQVFIPSDKAYGRRGNRDVIAPNSALIFEIELVKVLPPQ